MKTVRQEIGDTNDTVDFLIANAGRALTFLYMAKTIEIGLDRLRTIEQAHKAYGTILKHLPGLLLNSQQKTMLDLRLNLLRRRLVELGASLSEPLEAL